MSAGTKLFALFGELGIQGVEGAKDDLKDVANEGKKTKDSLAKSFEEMGQKAGELGRNMALGLTGVVTGAVATVEATREFRQDLGKLETTFKTTNQATGTATKTFKDLYAVLGEDDTSIEAANHLAMITNNEKDLGEWTDILTGVYATFGDSLPLEGLAEAANETMRVGQVTGPLADALNWAGVSEDEFNKKLEECTSNQEREALIRETLTDLYGEASETYKEINGDVMENNEAQAEMNLKMAEMAESLQPLITQGKEFLVEVLEKLSPVLTWIIDNINILAPIILGFLGTLFALNIASKIAGIIPIIATLNATMAANPVGAIIVVIGLLVTAFITLWNNCEGFRNFWIGLWENIKNVFEITKEAFTIGIEKIKETFTSFKENISNKINQIKNAITTTWNNIKTTTTNVFNSIKTAITNVWNAIKNAVTSIIDGIKNAVSTAWENIKTATTTVFEAIKTTASNVWNGIKTTISTVIDGIKTSVSNVFNGIKTTITNIWNGIKTTTTTVWNNIKTAITTPIENAKNFVKDVVDKIKGFFNFTVELPKIKLPHFKITPSGWELGDLLEGVIPKLGIEWYAKGGILDRPTAFGINGNNLMVGGEAGKEAIAPISELMKYTSAAVDGSNAGLEEKLDRLIGLLTNYLPMLSNRQVVLSTGELVGAMVSPMDKALGKLADKRERGY